jgi:aldehyde:ferredoxin oxidoreductase
MSSAGGDGLRVALCDHQQEVVGHAARDLAEELAREVGRRAVLAVGPAGSTTVKKSQSFSMHRGP